MEERRGGCGEGRGASESFTIRTFTVLLLLQNITQYFTISLFSLRSLKSIRTESDVMMLHEMRFLSYFEKTSSLVGLNFGLCIYVSMYV